jgi:hypothetical protein
MKLRILKLCMTILGAQFAMCPLDINIQNMPHAQTRTLPQALQDMGCYSNTEKRAVYK